MPIIFILIFMGIPMFLGDAGVGLVVSAGILIVMAIIYGISYLFNKKQYDKVNLERIVKSFYEKNHFSLMNFSDYYNNRDKYLFINETYFEDDRILIYRDYIPGNYSFIQISNFLVHENLINRLDEVDRFVKKKSMKLDLKGQ